MLMLWALVLHFIYLQFTPIDVIATNGNYKVDKTEVRAGDTITVTQDFCKTRNSVGTMRVYYRDGVYFLFNQLVTDVPAGCQKVNVIYEIPKTLPAGKYQILYVINYQITPFRSIEERIETDYFQVVK